MKSNNKFSIRDEVYQVFGKKAFGYGLFYSYSQSLRFELSVGGSFVEKFHQALSKGIEILDDLFYEQEDLHVCISFFGQERLLANLSIWRQLNRLGIKINKASCEIWQEQCPEDEHLYEDKIFRTFIVFPIKRAEMLKLLWSAIACDLDIRPRVNASVYFFSLRLKTLAHPYDDRGMDIIGTDYGIKQQLFNKFNHYLLNYDLEAMNNHFN